MVWTWRKRKQAASGILSRVLYLRPNLNFLEKKNMFNRVYLLFSSKGVESLSRNSYLAMWAGSPQPCLPALVRANQTVSALGDRAGHISASPLQKDFAAQPSASLRSLCDLTLTDCVTPDKSLKSQFPRVSQLQNGEENSNILQS